MQIQRIITGKAITRLLKVIVRLLAFPAFWWHSIRDLGKCGAGRSSRSGTSPVPPPQTPVMWGTDDITCHVPSFAPKVRGVPDFFRIEISKSNRFNTNCKKSGIQMPQSEYRTFCANGGIPCANGGIALTEKPPGQGRLLSVIEATGHRSRSTIEAAGHEKAGHRVMGGHLGTVGTGQWDRVYYCTPHDREFKRKASWEQTNEK